MKLILVRHGETASNVARFYAGRNEEPLSPTGVLQAEARAQELRAERVEVIYASPLRRAMQTGQIIARCLQCPLREDSRLIEMQMGPWEQKSETQVQEEFPYEWKTWMERPADLALPGRETLGDILQRYLAFASDLRQSPARVVVAVTHYALIRVAVLHAQGLPLNLYKTIRVSNCEAVPLEI